MTSMSAVEICEGCRRPGGPVCGDCRALVSRPVGAVRSLALEWGAVLVGIAAGIGFVTSLVYVAGPPLAAARLTAGLLAVSFFALRWAWMRLGRPHRFLLTPDGMLEIHRTIGGRGRVSISDLEDDKGAVVVRTGLSRYTVGSCEYRWAVELHRAIRARRALLRVPTPR
jgi:hypothetical protein